MILPLKATEPTLYFIGVTTAKSSIMHFFPLWAKILGLDGAVIKGIDIEIHAEPNKYRDVVEFIKNDKYSYGALVTTHKIDLYNAAKDMFDYLDPYAQMFGELSSISKKDGKLFGHAKDPISSGLSMESFIPKNYWSDKKGEVFCMGAGGSAIAIGAYLIEKKNGSNIPTKLYISNRSEYRLKEIERILNLVNADAKIEYHLTPEALQNDAILAKLKPNSLIINATGLGKDRPGSPLTDNCEFPRESLVWELNYRGELVFLHQAIKEKSNKGLHIEDGWVYFIHGWTQVIAEVFHLDLTAEKFNECERIANELRTAKK